MIKKKDFSIIDNEVKLALHEAFEFIKLNCVDHDYILFLADGEFKEKMVGSQLRLNPYSIDNREDYLKDETRQNFFIQFMRSFYSFPKKRPRVDDDEYRLTMELMIYTHIWESKGFLKQLHRIASLSNSESYKWKVEVPEMSKHEFIRASIRDILRQNNLGLAGVISKGFHTSLRNAFAHSEYHFNNHTKQIRLDTYKGASWDIKEISFDDWTKRFAYTALLSYHFYNERALRRQSLIKDFKKDNYLIVHPITERRFKLSTIYYDLHLDRFSFSRT